jgi:hypothetical protein
MWAINGMFGTGTRGFAIITSVIACGTYAVVFGLLHPPARNRALEALKVYFPVISWNGESDNLKNKNLADSKGKGKENNASGSGAQGEDVSPKTVNPKRSLISRFQRRKRRVQDHEKGSSQPAR